MEGWSPDKRVVIHPGEYYVTGREKMISTILGSCVAACLYDPVNKIIGMNHFLLDVKRYVGDVPEILSSDSGRYGMYAMELLINAMLKNGAHRNLLQAKVFGGGNVLDNAEDDYYSIGKTNCQFVLDYLKCENIPINAKSLGGYNGRIIHFLSTDYSVLVKKIKHNKMRDVGEQERQYWKSSLKIHARMDEESKTKYL